MLIPSQANVAGASDEKWPVSPFLMDSLALLAGIRRDGAAAPPIL